VDVGDIGSDAAAQGRTIFEDWTHVAVDINRNTDVLRRDVQIMPQNGRMLLFPASLKHSVESYRGERPCITIAFNLHHPGFQYHV
jgi:Putative 2OG-Fe(II) oxygenase